MKMKYEFAVRDIAGDYVLVPLGEAALHFSGMLTTSDVGAFIVQALEEEISPEALTEKLMAAYEVDAETAAADLKEFTDRLRQLDLIEE